MPHNAFQCADNRTIDRIFDFQLVMVTHYSFGNELLTKAMKIADH